MARHDHDPTGHWRAILFYGVVSVVVLAVGTIAIWSFLERQSLRRTLAPEPLPTIALITGDPDSPFAAAWIEALTRAEFSPTLVPLDKFEPVDGVLAFIETEDLTPEIENAIREHLARGGGIAVFGDPGAALGRVLGLTATSGESGQAFRFSEAASPVLARVQPGHEITSGTFDAAFLEEKPNMMVDARWTEGSKAAIAHFRADGGRILWFGFDPSKLWNPGDNQLGLMLRTAFRWVSSQPVSEAAAGLPASARTLTPAARLEVRKQGLSWSFDRLAEDGAFILRVRNGSKELLPNATVKVWYPERIEGLHLEGSWFSRRGVQVIPLDEERSALISLGGLRGHEDRLIKVAGDVRRPE